MYAMQYEIDLPADYDMHHLRSRVAAAWHTLDDRAGLGLKAYLFRERGIDNSPINQYACFYLWNDVGAMGELLLTDSGRFQNIIQAFGRPAVHHWTGIATMAGPAHGATPQAASRRLVALPTDLDHDSTAPAPAPGPGLGLAARIELEIGELERLTQREGVHTAALAVDPRDWQLLRFVLWEETAPRDDDSTEKYEVLHLSRPGIDQLPDGRNW